MNQVTSRYTRTAMLLHWLIAILVFVLFGLGWYMVDLPPGSDRGAKFALHKSIGLTVFVLLWVRLLWRLAHAPPPLPAEIPRWQQSFAQAVHKLFYIFLVLQPLSGYLSSSFSGHSTKYFGVTLPQWGWHNPPLNQFFTDIHELCSLFLLALIAAHIAGVISHALQPGGSVLGRMLPRPLRRV